MKYKIRDIILGVIEHNKKPISIDHDSNEQIVGKYNYNEALEDLLLFITEYEKGNVDNEFLKVIMAKLEG